MICTTHTSSQPCQAKFGANEVSIGIDNHCSVIMSHFRQDFVVPLRKEQRVINGFEGSKVNTIYEVTIAWTINDDTGHIYWLDKPKSLYVPNRLEQLISPQHWAHNATSANVDATILDSTQGVTHYYCDTLIWVGGSFVCTVPLEKKNISTLQALPDYTVFTAYCADVGYDPYLNDDKPD